MEYMLKVGKKLFNGKYSIADPDGFKSKLRLVNKQEKAAKLLRLGTVFSTILGDGSTTRRSSNDGSSMVKISDTGSSDYGWK